MAEELENKLSAWGNVITLVTVVVGGGGGFVVLAVLVVTDDPGVLAVNASDALSFCSSSGVISNSLKSRVALASFNEPRPSCSDEVEDTPADDVAKEEDDGDGDGNAAASVSSSSSSSNPSMSTCKSSFSRRDKLWLVARPRDDDGAADVEDDDKEAGEDDEESDAALSFVFATAPTFSSMSSQSISSSCNGE